METMIKLRHLTVAYTNTSGMLTKGLTDHKEPLNFKLL